MATKSPRVIESAAQTQGRRTVIATVLSAGASVFWHAHPQFDETFQVMEGELDVWQGDEYTTLRVGDTATIKRGTLHRYLVGPRQTTVRLTFEPGSWPFEQAMHILQGVQQEGAASEFSTPEGQLLLQAVITDLTNSHPIGDFYEQLEHLSRTHGAQLQQVKQYLLATYGR